MAEIETYFLYPGTLLVSRKPHFITTLLGSCVAVCIYDRKQFFGGMNHFLLPMWNGKGLASPKYGNIAIRQLVDHMQNMGSKPKDLIAKVFGGAVVLNSQDSVFHIGERNIHIAEQMLREIRVEIIASSTGGNSGRKIIFNTFTGEVKQKYLKKRQKN